jgi:hypothetical protein
MTTFVIMDKVLRQDDMVYKKALLGMRNGNMNEQDVDFLLSRFLENLTDNEKEQFTDALHLVPTWETAHQINVDYLKNDLSEPIARFKAELNSTKTNGKNCCVSESNLPLRNLLCVGTIVMLLLNFVVEENLMNGSVGIVRHICFKNPEGDANPDPSDYIVVEFPRSKLTQSLITGQDSKMIPITRTTTRCEKNCCSISAFPLQICRALTIHKSQGMTVGEGEQFEKVIVYLPENAKTPGLPLVACSRSKKATDFAIGNKLQDVSKKAIQQIGTTKAYDARRAFLKELGEKAKETQQPTINGITALHEGEIESNRSFEGGCEFLLKWYRNNF